MTGPEHYQAAEHWLTVAKEAIGDLDLDGEASMIATAQAAHMAQVHATLALAAATASQDGLSAGDWARVAGDEGIEILEDDEYVETENDE